MGLDHCQCGVARRSGTALTLCFCCCCHKGIGDQGRNNVADGGGALSTPVAAAAAAVVTVAVRARATLRALSTRAGEHCKGSTQIPGP